MSGGISINFKPSIKQSTALDYLMDKETLFIGYGGAAFSGKSYLLCYWLTIMCIAYPDTGWGLGRKELTTLKKTTLLTLFKVFDECNIKAGKDYNYNQQSSTITFYNKSQIFLIDMMNKPSDPLFTRFGGLELTGAAIDESAESTHNAIKILFTRLGRRNNNKHGISKKLLETFNPAKNHVYTRYYKPKMEGRELDGHRFVPALPKDNPSPEVEDYIRDIVATSDKTTIERLIRGNFEYDDDPDALCDFDKISDMWSNSFVEDGESFITADIALYGSDKFVLGIWSGWRLKEIITIDTMEADEVEAVIKKAAEKNKVPRSNIVYDADGLGSFLRGYLRGAKPFHNGAKALNDENYQNLKTQCAYKLAERINNNEIFIGTDKNKPEIIQEIEQLKKYRADVDGKNQILPKATVKELIGRSPDFSDMIMMRAYFEIAPKTIISKPQKPAGLNFG